MGKKTQTKKAPSKKAGDKPKPKPDEAQPVSESKPPDEPTPDESDGSDESDESDEADEAQPVSKPKPVKAKVAIVTKNITLPVGTVLQPKMFHDGQTQIDDLVSRGLAE